MPRPARDRLHRPGNPASPLSLREERHETHTLEGMTLQLSSRRRGALTVFAALLVSGLAVVGCSAPGSGSGAAPAPGAAAQPTVVAADELLGEFGLDASDVVAVVDTLDTLQMAERPEGLIASVRPDAVVFTAGNTQATLPMPDDLVYVSVAPYATQTHDCYFHSLTTCVGELQNADVQLTLIDDATVAELVGGAMTTFDNGFIGFWVPRGIQATLTVTHEGQTGTAPISTMNADDPTCITTLRVS